MEGFNSMVPTQGNDGSNTSFIPFPPSHGNVSSGMPCNSASGSSVQGVAAITSEPKTENQQAPQGPREPESNVDPKRLRRYITLSTSLYKSLFHISTSYIDSSMIYKINLFVLF